VAKSGIRDEMHVDTVGIATPRYEGLFQLLTIDTPSSRIATWDCPVFVDSTNLKRRQMWLRLTNRET